MTPIFTVMISLAFLRTTYSKAKYLALLPVSTSYSTSQISYHFCYKLFSIGYFWSCLCHIRRIQLYFVRLFADCSWNISCSRENGCYQPCTSGKTQIAPLGLAVSNESYCLHSDDILFVFKWRTFKSATIYGHRDDHWHVPGCTVQWNSCFYVKCG
jgi:hypothetical protein